MSALPNERVSARLASRPSLGAALLLVFLSACQSLPTTLQLEKPGQAARSVRKALPRPTRPVVPASDVKPVPAPAQLSPVEPMVDEQSNLVKTPGNSITISDSIIEGQETIDLSPAGTFACPSCPTGSCPTAHVGLPASAYIGWEYSTAGIPFQALEEYVCNGGDRETAVVVKRDWRVYGLHQGDTVVHFDTMDGQTHVVPSNDVCLYAPRFAAVRKVDGLIINEQHDRAAGVELPIAAVQSGEIDEATTVVQPLQPGRKHAIRTVQQFRERQPGEGIENHQRPATAQDQFLPFENLTIIRRGVYDLSEQARLAERLEAAIAWTHDQAPQILIDNKTAVQIVDNLALQSTYTYELAGKSRVRVCKIASKQNARPGETVDFTIRFDNVGDRVIGNVTLIDRLHERLELVPNTQSCTLKANFSTEDEDGSPRVLRWEIVDPLPVGQGGIVRFQCRVR